MKLQKPKLELPKLGKPNIGLSIPKPNLEAFMKLPRKEKLHYIGYAVLLPATVLLFIYGVFTNASTPDPVAQKKPAATQQQQQTQKKDEAPQMMENASVAKGSLLTMNPFVEASNLASLGDGKPKEATTIGKAHSHINLPEVPTIQYNSPSYMPRPSIPSSLPSIPSVSVPAPASVPRPADASSSGGSQPTVAGVLTGEDGNNMAIMSDGRVVSAGDNYNGDRIAYIGGDGIQFDNGHSIGYK